MIRRFALLCALVLGAAAAQARPAARVAPYLEVDQTVVAGLGRQSEVLTYTTLAAGVDASIAGPNAEGQVSYRYEHQIGWGRRAGDSDIHSGLARGRLTVAPGLSLEGGAIAARARSDMRGPALGLPTGGRANIAQVYSAYAGPTLVTEAGGLDVMAAYRIGYTKVDNGDPIVLAPGQARLDLFDDAVSHLATASIGMSPRALPLGWKLSGAWQHENAGQLSQRFDDRMVRGEVTVPISHSVALVGGIGHEAVEISQRRPLRDAGGAPVIDGNGRFVADRAAPRQLAYDYEGLIWDVGVLWRPSHRTTLEAHVGKRYRSTIYTGSFQYRMNGGAALSVTVYDGLQSFSRQLNAGLAGLPTAFGVFRNPLTQNYGGCIYGSADAGGCLGDAFQSISTAQYRARGATAVLSVNRGPWSGGVGIGHARRRFIAPADSLFFSLDGVTDRSWFAEAQLGRRIDAKSSAEGSLFANRYDSGIAFAPDVTSTGATAAYYRLIGRRLSASAALGLYRTDVDGAGSETVGTALLGMRYTF
ncbi:hypothetical protein [Sphingomonas flavalba]|uniref:hypothetical protein n=1 Tax=Sphingomonas flavalba TaxID=2559804 RepID=UPI00109DABDD|nr:hypothetical protein [Sphingomonas flavalba]